MSQSVVIVTDFKIGRLGLLILKTRLESAGFKGSQPIVVGPGLPAPSGGNERYEGLIVVDCGEPQMPWDLMDFANSLRQQGVIVITRDGAGKVTLQMTLVGDDSDSLIVKAARLAESSF